MTKLDQVLPPRLRGEVAAVAEATVALPGMGAPVDPDILMTLARAARDRVRVRFGYAARGGVVTERDCEPYRLVTTGRRWYLLAYDPGRGDWRTFRLDRMSAVRASTFRFAPRPAPDAATYVRDAVTKAPYAHLVTARLDAPAAAVRDRIPATVGQVSELLAAGQEGGPLTEVVVGADSLDGLAWHLLTVAVDLDARLQVVGPPGFAAIVADYPRRLAARLHPPGSAPA